MSVQYLSTFDPMLEFNFILERCFGQPANIPNSVQGICESLSMKYSIPWRRSPPWSRRSRRWRKRSWRCWRSGRTC